MEHIKQHLIHMLQQRYHGHLISQFISFVMVLKLKHHFIKLMVMLKVMAHHANTEEQLRPSPADWARSGSGPTRSIPSRSVPIQARPDPCRSRSWPGPKPAQLFYNPCPYWALSGTRTAAGEQARRPTHQPPPSKSTHPLPPPPPASSKFLLLLFPGSPRCDF